MKKLREQNKNRDEESDQEADASEEASGNIDTAQIEREESEVINDLTDTETTTGRMEDDVSDAEVYPIKCILSCYSR